jgi:transposase
MPKRYSPKLKFQIVMELIKGEKTPGQIAKAYGVHTNSAIAWKNEFLEKGAEVFTKDGNIADYERRIRELEQLLGKKEVEIAILKNFLGQQR